MDRLVKALMFGLAAAVAYSAATKAVERETSAREAAEQVFLFPQLSVSAAADRDETSDSEDVEFAFKLSEILDSFR